MKDENQIAPTDESPPTPPPLSSRAKWFRFKVRFKGKVRKLWEEHQENFGINLLTITAFLSVAIGLTVLTIFLFKLSSQYSIHGNTIEMDKTGQVGDFVGGVVGSVWSLTGVLLFYAALQLQRKELKDNRVQFQVNRLTDIIYRQVDLFNRTFDLFTLKDLDVKGNGKEYRGMAAVTLLKRRMEWAKEIEKQFTDEPEKEKRLLSLFEENCAFAQMNENELARLYEALDDHITTVRTSLAKEDVPPEDLNELKGIFYRNIGLDFLNSSELLVMHVEALIKIKEKKDKDFNKLFSDLCAIRSKIGLISQFRNLVYDKKTIRSELANRELYSIHT